MTTLNSVSLTSDQFKLSAKYLASENKTSQDPLEGCFNYIHLIKPLNALTSSSANTTELMKKVLEEFHQQSLPEMKLKLQSIGIAKQTNATNNQKPGVVKFVRSLCRVAINHGNFRTDQIAKGDGNSSESLIYSLRIRSSKLTEDGKKDIHDNLLHDSSTVVTNMEGKIRDAVGHGKALETAIQSAESVLIPYLRKRLGDSFDLKVKLKRPDLFSEIQVAISSTNYQGDNRALSRNQLINTWTQGQSAPTHYALLPLSQPN